ncbi:MAG: amino acid adenylation domain-containing protein [Gammaproteobacteria bacterium]|nr:amino acid adenylation domain-containing protein [Gammaproteobacteria bacterium]
MNDMNAANRDVEAIYPLSPMQQGMLFHAIYNPGGEEYFNQLIIRLQGELDRDAFPQAWRRLVERHGILRTLFLWERQKPLQVVLKRAELPWVEQDWRDSTEAQQAERLEEWLAADRRLGFALDRAPLLRVGLLRLAEQRYQLVLSYHHALLEGWSWALLSREVFEIYRLLRAGQEPDWPAPRPYRDYIVWLQRQDPRAAESFWREQLKGFATPTPLPLSRPTTLATPRYGEYRLQWPAALGDELRNLARRERLTLSVLLQGVWAVLLSRYSGQDDVLFGATVSGRSVPLPGIETIVGLFINTLPVRVRVAGTPTVADWLRGLLREQGEREQFAYAPLVDIQNGSEIPRPLALFDSLLVFENFPVNSELNDARLGLRLDDVHAFERTHYPLTLMFRTGAESAVQFLYDENRYTRSAVERLARHFQQALEAIAADPQQPVARIDLIGASEKALLLGDFNATDSPYPQDHGIHRLIAEQAARRPQAPAVGMAGRVLNYGELDRRSNQLAHYLRGLGVGPETRVGVCLERSPELVVAVLGVLKAGGAYVPLDPAFPPPRLALMCDGLDLLLSEGGAQEEWAAARVRHLMLDRERPTIALCPDSDPAVPLGPANLAYMIYTSGSTGRPKGVQISHGSLLNFLYGMARQLGLESGDTWLAVTTLSFDIAALELFLPLMVGAQVVLAERDTVSDGARLAELLRDSQATVMQATPAGWRLLLDSGWTGSPGLTLLCGGEALPTELSARLSAAGGTLWNLYGPTETTIWSTAQAIRPEAPSSSSLEPIGRPIANTQVYVLDRQLQPAPIGAPGELCIAGDGVARGYFAQPGLTAERFVPNPFGQGDRLYRTGDLARYREDGVLEYLGRQDQQVKVRGVRIEPGDVEAAMLEHPGVRQSAVIARDDRLLAYWVPERTEADDAAVGDEQVSAWRQVWNEAYEQGAPGRDPTLNTAGWRDSFTGELLPEAQMREWAESTVERILAHRPRRVLEIGCGTGMLLWRVAPHCERYVATDVSGAALDYVKTQLERRPLPQTEIALRRSAADELQDLPDGSFDAVVLNSVAQYFPSVDYLVRVLETVVDKVAEGGIVFIGDVRHRGLLPVFHAAVQTFRAPGALPVAELRRRIAQSLARERELALDPALFQALLGHLPSVGAVDIRLKGGRASNEMNMFRYDVVLKVGAMAESSAEWPTLDGSPPIGLSALRRHLTEARPERLRIQAVPNARLMPSAAIGRRLQSDAYATVAELRQALTPADGLEPDDFETLGRELGYATAIGWSAEPDAFEVVFQRDGQAMAPTAANVGRSGPSEVAKSWRNYANRPFTAAVEIDQREWREFMAQRLPAALIPSQFVMLESLPLTPNGKVDRKALPIPGVGKAGVFVAPRTPREEILAGLFAEVLDRARVGATDDFFEMGGHSLLATRLIARLRGVFQVDLPLRTLFEAPTVGSLSERLAAFKGSDPARPVAPPIRPSSPEESADAAGTPLSFAQERIAFLDRLVGYSGAYHLPFALRMDGHLDSEALRRGFAEIVRRHRVLRGVLTETPQGVRQTVLPDAAVACPLIDLSPLPAAERDAEVRRLGREEAESAFALNREPLLRLKLLRLDPERHVLLCTLHHIAADGWSLGVLVDELRVLYPAYLKNESAALADLPIQYADYALWQRRYLDAETVAARLGYWRTQLDGAPALLELPTDRPRPPMQRYRGDLHEFALDADLTGQLRRLSREYGVTLYMALLAGWATLLYRYSGQTDILVGSPVANRTPPETERLIGCFVNTLALRLNLGGNPRFRELLERVRRISLDAYEHQDLPFEKLVEALQPERSLSYSPLFQVMFVLQNAPFDELELPGLRLAPLESVSVGARFDLTLSLRETADGRLHGGLEYDTDLFDAATVQRLAEHFRILLTAAATDPKQRLRDLPLLSEAERRQLVRNWNQTAAGFPETACLHQLVERQVRRTPDAPALICGERTMSYRDLNARANRLAHYLRGIGVGPDVTVGLCAARDGDMLVGLLAILKAGGAYLPLDPAYPRERLRFMLEDGRAPVVLTQTGLADTLPEPVSPASATMQRIWLDQAEATLAGFSTDDPPCIASPRNLAYLLYTSGSTGRPKGVAIEHRSAVAMVSWAQRAFAPEQCRGVLASTSLCFDLSVFELFLPLCGGGQIVLAEHALHLPALPAADQVTLINTVPSAIAELLRYDGIPPNAQTINLAGEPLPQHLVDKLYRHPAVKQVFNLYGPSEDTTYSTYTQVLPGRTPSIGRPIDDTRAYILDAQFQPTPIGVSGELYLAGAGLARGYLARPDLTAERFLPDPFAEQPGGRMYRTGDRARYRADGTIDFLGRIDHQVKVRGFRIELGEIETVLMTHPGLQEVAVIVREDAPGEQRLVAYVAGPEPIPSAGELRDRLRDHLPGYMIPSAFVDLPALPRTPNGKLDRQALPAPERTTTAKTAHSAPRNAQEMAIAAVWQEVLQRESVGNEDNFFDLGGHSLLLLEVQHRLGDRLKRTIDVLDLFRYPTIGALARHLSGETQPIGVDASRQRAQRQQNVLQRQQVWRNRRSL